MLKEDTLKFDTIYHDTYEMVLKYVVCNSYNINDVNDIIQEVYFELYKILDKKDIDNINAYLIGIARNKIKKHYSIFYKIKTLSFFNKNEDDIEYIDIIKDDIDLEKTIINNDLIGEAWKYIKTKKSIVVKIFFLYYKCDFTIKQISDELNVSESNVKNYLYRTLNEIKNIFSGDV